MNSKDTTNGVLEYLQYMYVQMYVLSCKPIRIDPVHSRFMFES